MKYTVKTKLDNITQLKNGTFSFDEKIISIQHQIKNYPTPISDGDEQFNFLLIERDRLLNDSNN